MVEQCKTVHLIPLVARPVGCKFATVGTLVHVFVVSLPFVVVFFGLHFASSSMVHILVIAIVVSVSILGVGPLPIYSRMVWTSHSFLSSIFRLLSRLLLPFLSALRLVSKMLQPSPVVVHCCSAVSRYPVSDFSATSHFHLISLLPLMVVVVLLVQEQHFHLLTDPYPFFSRHPTAGLMPLIDNFLRKLPCTFP